MKDLAISKGNFNSFKNKAKAAFNNGTLDEEMVIDTLEAVYGDNEKVRAWGKKTATSSKLELGEVAAIEMYLSMLEPEERAAIADLYYEIEADEGRIASLALDELTYEEALELMAEIRFDYVPTSNPK